MRIPSTSDLVQAHSNRAYDKMEVISDHIHELMDLYEWIFNLRAYLASLLAGYVTIGTDQTITGKKTFENLKAHVLNIANATEVLNEGYITTGYYNDSDPALIVHFTAYDDDVPYETRLYLVSRPGGNPYFVIPPTNANDNNSAVRLDYLKSILTTLNDGSYGLANRVSALENRLVNVLPLDGTPTEGSSKGVTSNGIWVAIQNAVRGVMDNLPPFPVASTIQKGIMQVGDYLTVDNGVVGVDADALATYIRSQLNIDTSISGSLLTYSSVELVIDEPSNLEQSNNTLENAAQAIGGEDRTKAFLANNSGNGNAYLSPKIDLGSSATVGSTNIKCTNLSTGSSNYFIPLRTVIILTDFTAPASGAYGQRAYFAFTVRCWFRNRDFTLSAEDITEINDRATQFIASRIGQEGISYTIYYAPGSESGQYREDAYYDTGDLT